MNTRSQRTLGLFGALIALTMISPPLYAQGFYDPPGDDDPCGNPLVECLGGTEAASAVGDEINRRYDEGDCTGLGPEGCLGLVLHKLMCTVDGREWVQEACGNEPTGDPPPEDPPEEDPPEEDPPAGDPPEEDPNDAEESRSAPVSVLESNRMNQGLRTWLDGHEEGRPVHALKIGGRPAYRFFLEGRYEHQRDDRQEYYAILSAVQAGTGERRKVILGGEDDLIYAMDHAWFSKAVRASR